VTWNTTLPGSSQVTYSGGSLYDSSTDEIDVSPRVTSHSVNLSGLLACSVYYVKAISTDNSSNTVTSDPVMAITTGCPGGATSTSDTVISQDVNTGTGGTTTLAVGGSSFNVNAAAGYANASSSAVIQIRQLDRSIVLGAIGSPSNLTGTTNSVFDVKAFVNGNEVIDTFYAPITISYTYSPSEISGINESSLWMYHYHDGSWQRLDDCTVNTNTHTITCTTPNFSVFGLFGTPIVASAPAQQTYSSGPTAYGGTEFGCKDPKATNYEFWAASKPDMCVYASSSTSSTVDVMTSAKTTASLQSLVTTAQPFMKNLYYGDVHPDIKRLQVYLNAHGYTVAGVGIGSSGHESTRFGSATQLALIKFQKDHAVLPATGSFGPKTRALINGK
jgi:Putative peptidoglycan binding domain